MSTKQNRLRPFSILLLLLYVFTLLGFVYFLNKGIPYYRLSPSERPFSTLHELYKPGGLIGHGLGILGTGMMLLMMIYSIRKRISFFQNWGNIKDWLNFHIYLGIMGPLFILLHTSFKFGGIIAVSFWSMVAVALSGFIGRYLYIKIPQEIKDRKEKVSAHSDFIENQNAKWQKDLENVEAKYGQIEPDHRSENMNASNNMGLFFLQIIWKDISNFFYLRRISQNYSAKHHLARKEFKQIRKALIQRTKLADQIKFLKQLEHLFHYWHVIHRPFAYVMLTILFVHVAIAIILGSVWIF